MRLTRSIAALLATCCCIASASSAAETVDHPFLGVMHITRTETTPRAVTMHIVRIDLSIPGIHLRLTPPGGTRETVRQTTLTFLNAQQAQVAVNGHFFLPFPSADLNAMVIGLAASDGNVYSAFEAPVQSYALVTEAPAINVDPDNGASIVHKDPAAADGMHVVEPVLLWNALAGSAQIVTNGIKTIPLYRDAAHPDGALTPPGPANYSNSNSWYNLINARTAIGLSQDNQRLFLFTVDRAGGSLGMSVGEVADVLINDYGVYNALNLDGGGSTTLAMENPRTHERAIVNVSSDNPAGRAVASSLAVFAAPDTVPPSTNAALVPPPNRDGWNNSDATLVLTAADNPGGAVLELHYASSGAHSEAGRVVPGDTASRTITEEGVTAVSYFASDYLGNAEAARNLIVRIDKTRPVIGGLPNDTCELWPVNGQWRHVATVAAADALSGVASGSLQVTVESNEPSDMLNPDSRLRLNDDGSIDVELRAKRLGDTSGRVYALTASVRDLAGNWATASAACVVPHDRRKR
jgi:phosphodiester glycosidase